MVTGRYAAFSNNKKMVTILHRELEHKVEKVQHMKLEVMRPKTKNSMNFQPEYTVTDQSTLIGMEGRGGGEGAYELFSCEKGGLIREEGGGGLIEDLRYINISLFQSLFSTLKAKFKALPCLISVS